MLLDELVKVGDRLAALPPEEREKALRLIELRAVNGAAADQVEVPPPVHSLGDYLEMEIPEPPKVVGKLVVRGEITATIGKSGKGKSSMNLHRLIRWSAGLPMFTELPDVLVPEAPVKVLVIENEGAAGMFQEKLSRMVNAEGYLDYEARQLARENLYVWGDGGYSGLKVDQDKDYELIRRGVDLVKPDILFVEPLRGLWRGDENSNTEIVEVLDRFLRVATESGLAVILSHHERKGGVIDGVDLMDLARGASALDGAAAVMENFRQAKGGDFRELSYSKARYGGAPAPIRMWFDKETDWYRFVPEEQIERDVLNFMQSFKGDAVTVNELKEALDEPDRKIRQVLNRLASGDAPKVKNVGRIANGAVGYRLVTVDGEETTGGLNY